MTLKKLQEVYQHNILSVGMVQPLADELGVSVESLAKLGTGCRPGDGDRTYTFPTRDSNGNTVGIQRRYENGKKFFISGSKHGLFFEINPDFTGEKNDQRQFIRVQTAGVECPICGHSDWCLVSNEDVNNPGAVICGRIEEGSEKHIKNSGYLHILKPGGKTGDKAGLLLANAEATLVTEGASDTAAAMDLGFVAVGRSSALCGLRELPDLLHGRTVIVVGDNDPDDTGRKGMDQTAAILGKSCKEVITVLPPGAYKDLRSWKTKTGLTKEDFKAWVEAHGTVSGGVAVFPDDIAFNIARLWLRRCMTVDGLPTVRCHKGQWLYYSDNHYQACDTEEFRGNIYSFLEGALYYDAKGNPQPYKPTRSKVTDVIDALSNWCTIDADPPSWLEDRGLPDPVDLIAFRNGILDVNKYIDGKTVLYDPTPALFSYHILPYDFDEDAGSKQWDNFLEQIFNGDQDKIKLLSQWFGYNCVPDMSYEKLALFTGRPRAGKGVVLNVMTAMLGREQCTSTSFQSLCSEFGYQPLVGKLAAILGDAKVPKQSEAGKALEKILQVVGGDPVGVRSMWKGSLPQVFLTSRFTIAMNDLPNLPDCANALEPRLNVLTFPNSYVGREDVSLKRTLCKEATEGKLINFALRGLRSLRQAGKFVEPASAKQTIAQMKELTQPVSAFIYECCDAMPPGANEQDYYVPLDILYQAWVAWCKGTGRIANTRQTFGRWMTQSCPTVGTVRLKVGERKHAVYSGIKLCDWVKREYFLG